MNNQTNFLRFLVFLACFLAFLNVCTCGNVKKSIEDQDENDEDDNEKEESMAIAVETDINSNTNALMCSRRSNSQMHEIRNAEVRQFPFAVAVMSHQNDYLCAGSVVANGLVLTTASCTQRPVSYVLLNTTRDKKDEGAAMLHVIKTEKFPTYSGIGSLKDVGLLYTEKHNSSLASKIKLSNYTTARSLIDVEAIGYGLNAEIGQPKELQYIGMELRSPLESNDILRAYFDCVETKISTCFRDTGGAAIFDHELVGIVVQGQDDCTKEMSSTYAINKKMADILPTFTFKAWLDEKIKKSEDAEEPELTIFPVQPAIRRTVVNRTTTTRKRTKRTTRKTTTRTKLVTKKYIKQLKHSEVKALKDSTRIMNSPIQVLLFLLITLAIS